MMIPSVSERASLAFLPRFRLPQAIWQWQLVLGTCDDKDDDDFDDVDGDMLEYLFPPTSSPPALSLVTLLLSKETRNVWCQYSTIAIIIIIITKLIIITRMTIIVITIIIVTMITTTIPLTTGGFLKAALPSLRIGHRASGRAVSVKNDDDDDGDLLILVTIMTECVLHQSKLCQRWQHPTEGAVKPVFHLFFFWRHICCWFGLWSS